MPWGSGPATAGGRPRPSRWWADGPAIYGMFRIISRSRRDARGVGYGWLLVGCGTAASIGGNVAHAQPNLVAGHRRRHSPGGAGHAGRTQGRRRRGHPLATQGADPETTRAPSPARPVPASHHRPPQRPHRQPGHTAAALGSQRRALPAGPRSDPTTVGAAQLQAAYAQRRPDGQPWTARTLAEAAGCGRSSVRPSCNANALRLRGRRHEPARLSWQLRDAALGYASRGIPVLPLHHPFPHHGNLQPVPMANSCHVLRSGRDARVAIRAAASPPSTPSAPGSMRGQGRHLVTEPGSWPGGLAIPRPTSAWPVAIASTFWTLTAPPAPTPSRNSPRPMAWRARGRWSAPAGWWHYYLAPTVSATLDPGPRACRWRGRGGYVVAPPSRHASGHPYRVGGGRDLDTPPGPGSWWSCSSGSSLANPATDGPGPASGRRRRPRRPLRTGGPGQELARVATARDRPTQQLWESTRNLYNLVATGALDHRARSTRTPSGG